MSERQVKKQRKDQPENQTHRKKADKPTVIFNTILVILIVVVVGLGVYAVGKEYLKNNPSQSEEQTTQTVSEYVQENGTTVEDFIATYGLDAETVTGDTDMATACGMMTLEKFAEFSEMTVDEIKTQYGLGENVTNEMTWQEAQGYVPVSKVIEMSGGTYEDFLAGYGLTEEELPADTIWNDAIGIISEAQAAMASAEATQQPEETPADGSTQATADTDADNAEDAE